MTQDDLDQDQWEEPAEADLPAEPEGPYMEEAEEPPSAGTDWPPAGETEKPTLETPGLLPEELDDADRGTPEMDQSLRQGCSGCFNVTLLVFVIMVASVLGTCALQR